MPEVTLTKDKLPAGHPALTKDGRWKPKAKRLLYRAIIPTRFRPSRLQGRYPVRNTLLFNRIADMLEIFPESYDQRHWGIEQRIAPCSTAFCIAGHAAHETGWQPDSSVTFLSWDDVERQSGRYQFEIAHVGALELGLTELEATILFDAAWKPKIGTPAEALRHLGDGALVTDVSLRNEIHWTGEWVHLLDEYSKRPKIRVTGKKE